MSRVGLQNYTSIVHHFQAFAIPEVRTNVILAAVGSAKSLDVISTQTRVLAQASESRTLNSHALFVGLNKHAALSYLPFLSI